MTMNLCQVLVIMYVSISAVSQIYIRLVDYVPGTTGLCKCLIYNSNDVSKWTR